MARYPNYVEEASEPATEADIAWAAGFLEGEGTFTPQGKPPSWGGRCVAANQRNTAQPLVRLQKLFGGSVRWHRSQKAWAWKASGEKGVNVMLTIYPLLSKRRQRQVCAALKVGDVIKCLT
jgi:hypothetical protein